jgi:predicted transcriptional regulator of viral defense system
MPASLQVLPDTFTTATARARGVHPRDLYAWRDSGEVVELSRGVFRRADAEAASWPDLLAVAYRAPHAIVCCVSAAAVHGLTDELPGAVQIAVAARSHPPRIEYPPTSVFRFDEATFEIGVSQVDAAPGEPVRIYDAARTVVDLIRLRHRLGEPIAFGALNRYLRVSGARPGLLLQYAERLDAFGPVARALEVANAS